MKSQTTPHFTVTTGDAAASLSAGQLYNEAKHYREQYPEGTRIVLEQMNDPYHPVPSGTKGTIRIIDDGCNFHIDWDNGRTLSLVPQVDLFRLLSAEEAFEETRLKEFVDHICVSMKPGHAPQTFVLPDLSHGVQVRAEKVNNAGLSSYTVSPCSFDYESARVTVTQDGKRAVFGDRNDLLRVCRKVIALYLPLCNEQLTE